jgi:hypothetical protein
MPPLVTMRFPGSYLSKSAVREVHTNFPRYQIIRLTTVKRVRWLSYPGQLYFVQSPFHESQNSALSAVLGIYSDDPRRNNFEQILLPIRADAYADHQLYYQWYLTNHRNFLGYANGYLPMSLSALIVE